MKPSRPSHKYFEGFTCVLLCLSGSVVTWALSALLVKLYLFWCYFSVNYCVRLRFVLSLLWIHVNNLALLCFFSESLALVLSVPWRVSTSMHSPIWIRRNLKSKLFYIFWRSFLIRPPSAHFLTLIDLRVWSSFRIRIVTFTQFACSYTTK